MRRRSRVSVDDGANGLQVLAPSDPDSMAGGNNGSTDSRRWSASRMDELVDALTQAEDKARAAEERVAQLEAKLLGQVSANEQLESRLEGATGLIEELQERYNAKISKLRTEIEVCNRRVQNAKYVSEANEVLAAESQVREIESAASATTGRTVHQLLAESRAMDMRVRVERLGARLQGMVSAQVLERVCGDLSVRKIDIFDLEGQLRQLYSDPQLSDPWQSAKRRQVERLEKRLAGLRQVFSSEAELRQQLEVVRDVADQLCTAAARGDLEAARLLLRRGVSVNVVDGTGLTPLLYACGAGRVEMVRELVEQGADVVDEDEARDKPLVLAARYGHGAVVQLLLQRGAPVDSAEGQSRKTALHVAAEQGHEAVVELLLNCGADVNRADAGGNTPLHVVARTAYLTIAVLLIDRGAKTGLRNNAAGGGQTAMEVAHSVRNFSFVSVIGRYLGNEIGVANAPPYSLSYNPLAPKAAEALLSSLTAASPQQEPARASAASAASLGQPSTAASRAAHGPSRAATAGSVGSVVRIRPKQGGRKGVQPGSQSASSQQPLGGPATPQGGQTDDHFAEKGSQSREVLELGAESDLHLGGDSISALSYEESLTEGGL